ncbi:MAG: OmpA family protein [Betaproteobacteria bacterium]
MEAGELRLHVQYDLKANHIVFAGQLGVPDPDPPPRLARAEPPAPLAPKKAPVSLVWTGVFPYNGAALTPQAPAELEREVIPKLRGLAELRYVNVNGHTDPLGPLEYNQRLSEKRAEAVRDYLVAQGVDADKIEVFGHGKTLPVKSCREEKNRAALIACLAPNRRVVIELRGTPR